MNIAIIIIGAVVAIAAYALGWLERNQQALDRERARRAPDGKFRSVRGGVR